MKMCEFAGCVSGADEGDRCPIHRQPVNGRRRCLHCQGTGRHFYSGQGLTMACQICGGIGFMDSKRRAPKDEAVPVSERGLIVASEDEL
jgi:hypothetical protein